MKAVVFHGIGDIRLDDVAEPKIQKPTDAIVQITTSAICGTDLHFIRGTLPGVKPGTILGHEAVGFVVEVGNDVRNLRLGDRVVIPSTIACGVCAYCRAGYFSQCDNANPNGRTAGTAFFGQTIDLAQLTEAEIAHAGIGRKFQKPTIFENHSVFENLELAMKADKRVRTTLWATLSSAERDRVAETLRLVRLADAAERAAGLLSHGQKQWLEIGMLLVQEPRLLLLDEPVAGMSDDKTERTAELFLSLAGQHSLVVVEHDMAFIEKIARKVTVLHEGRVLAEGPMAAVQADPRVIEVYLGR